MPRITPIDPATATGEVAVQLKIARQLFGGVPNLIATAARSPAAVSTMLSLFSRLGQGEFSARQGEQIALAIAQSNRCGYCLSAHTAVGKIHGLTAAELDSARRARAADPTTEAMLTLAVSINESRGHVGDEAISAARTAGLSDSAIVELVAHVALNVFTNYLNNVAGTTVDFPEVSPSAA